MIQCVISFCFLSLTRTFDGYIPWTADVHTYSIDDFLQVSKVDLSASRCISILFVSVDKTKASLLEVPSIRLNKTC